MTARSPARAAASAGARLHLGSPADLGRLQRMIGNRAVGTLLARRATVEPPRRVLARLRLSPDSATAAVEKVPFMKGKLAGQLRGEAMSAQVRRQVEAYNAMFKSRHRGRTNTGVMLAMALEGVARMIAEELYDPSIQAELAIKLFEIYESEIKAATGLGGGSGGADESLGLAKVLVGDDPLALFMHGELRVEVAAQRIRDMATDVGAETGKAARSPEKMFHLLRHKWEAQMAAQSRSKVQRASRRRAPPTTSRKRPGSSRPGTWRSSSARSSPRRRNRAATGWSSLPRRRRSSTCSRPR